MSDYKIIAPFYDFLLSPFLASIRQHVRDIVINAKPHKVLDVCCGTGEQVRMLRKQGVDAVGIDLSKSMLKIANKDELKTACFLQDASAMEFEDGAFDFVMTTLALHETEWEMAKNILDEMYRVLKKGGHALIVDYDLNEKTGAFARRFTKVVEFLAGREHNHNFLHYNRAGGLEALIDKNQYKLTYSKQRASKSIVIKLFKRM